MRYSRSTPTYALAHAYIGDILVQLHRYKEAIKPLRKALRLIKAAPSVTPDLPTPESVHVLLGTAFRELGRTRAGAAHFRQALQLNPRNRDALEQVAASYFRRKHYRKALELYRRQLEIDPDKAATHANIGAALSLPGTDRKKQSGAWERALSLDPTLEMARTNLERMQKTVRQPGQ